MNPIKLDWTPLERYMAELDAFEAQEKAMAGAHDDDEAEAMLKRAEDRENAAQDRAKARMNAEGFFQLSDGTWRNSKGETSTVYDFFLRGYRDVVLARDYEAQKKA